MDTENTILNTLKARFGDTLTAVEEVGNELRLTVTPEAHPSLCLYLFTAAETPFDYPADLTARDTGEQIVLWYRLVSIRANRTVIVRVLLPREAPLIDSVTPIWPGMDWHERECFDLYGVRFRGHPDDGDPARMRILLPEDWEGHPFRSDYTPVFSGNPLHGPQQRN